MFQKGHTPWNKGKSWSIEVRRMISESHKGKHLSREHIQKIAKANTGKHRSEEIKKKLSESHKGQIPWNKGKKNIYSQEHLQFLSKKMKGNTFGNGHIVTEETRKQISEKLTGHAVSEETRIKIREKRLEQVFPLKDTSIEVAIQTELDRLGIAYEKHIGVCGVCQPDIVFPEKQVAVFCDGDYWHSLRHIVKKDRLQSQILNENSWTVVRFWGHELTQAATNCAMEILEALQDVSMRRSD